MLRFPDGTLVEGDARSTGDRIDVALYDRTVPARRMDPVFADAVHAIDETLEPLRVDEPEYAGGSHRVSIVARASVAKIGAEDGAPDLDPRRFRMLIEVDDVEAFGEDGWVARRLRVGEAIVRVARRMPRCVMTTLDPDTGAADFPTLDVLARTRKIGNDLLLGVVADVERAGIVGRGDPLEPLD
jgi:hypothetical protein